MSGWAAHSAELDKIFPAFVAFQAEVEDVKKGRTANIGQYSYSYADLGDSLSYVRPLLAKHGLATTQSVKSDGDDVYVWTTVIHESGQYFTTQALGLPAGKTAQNAGSGITYARRYSILPALGLATEDDDGASAGSRDDRRSEADELEAKAKTCGWTSRAAQQAEWDNLVTCTQDLAVVKAWVKARGLTLNRLTTDIASEWLAQISAAADNTADAAADPNPPASPPAGPTRQDAAEPPPAAAGGGGSQRTKLGEKATTAQQRLVEAGLVKESDL